MHTNGLVSTMSSVRLPRLAAALLVLLAAAACHRAAPSADSAATPAPRAVEATPVPTAPTSDQADESADDPVGPLAAPAARAAGGRKAKCPTGMAALDGGSFTGKRGAFTIAAFCLDRTEVTLAKYRACVKKGTCTEPDPEAGEGCNWSTSGDPPEVKRDQHPVNCVDQAQAAAYCAARGLRLPTAEELEWAQRGGAAGTTFPWGDDELPRRVCSRANKNPDVQRAPVTCPVGSCPAGDSPDGIHDLSGNVAEWTDSAPKAGAPQRLVCGGQTSCQAGSINRVDKTMAAGFCLGQAADQKFEGVGFRCARTR